jgi:toxin ParE1/3/4
MAYKIVWSNDAGDELIEIISYYRERTGNNIAKNIHTRIKTKVKKLLDGPKMGTIVPLIKELGITNYRQIIENPWIIYYRIENQLIYIVSIIDGRRNLEEILYKKVIDGKIK